VEEPCPEPAKPTARMLFGLYGAWAAFAAALNFAIWRLN
jgi:tryptophan-rich sensory protein